MRRFYDMANDIVVVLALSCNNYKYSLLHNAPWCIGVLIGNIGNNNNNGISLSPDLNNGVLTFHGKLGIKYYSPANIGIIQLSRRFGITKCNFNK